jgi:hypothetical protein
MFWRTLSKIPGLFWIVLHAAGVLASYQILLFPRGLRIETLEVTPKEGVKVGQGRAPRWPGDAPHHTQLTNPAIPGPNDFSQRASNRQGASSCWRYTCRIPTFPVAVLTPISVRRSFRPQVPYFTLHFLDPSKPPKVCWIYTVTYCMIRYVHYARIKYTALLQL